MTTSSSPPAPTTARFHITRGVALQIPAGGLSITFDENGEAKMEVKALLLRLDSSVYWLEIALDHLVQTKAKHDALAAAQAEGKDLGDLLQDTFKAAMQAIVAAATIFEALYAASRDCMPPERQAQRTSGCTGGPSVQLLSQSS
jgi:hypothetical protein